MKTIKESILAIVAELIAPTRYHGIYRYRVVKVASDKRVSLQIVNDALTGLPDTIRVPQANGVAGAVCDPKLGSFVYVAFVDGDPNQPPIIVGYDDATPPTLSLSATTSVDLAAASGPVVRYGDVVTVGASSGPIAWSPGGSTGPISRVKA